MSFGLGVVLPLILVIQQEANKLPLPLQGIETRLHPGTEFHRNKRGLPVLHKYLDIVFLEFQSFEFDSEGPFRLLNCLLGLHIGFDA